MFGVAAVLVLPVLVASGPSWLLTVRGATVASYLATATTFLACRLFGYGLRHTSAQTPTTLTLVEPAVAAMLGVAVLSERLPVISWCGPAVLAVGLVLLTFSGSARRRR